MKLKAELHCHSHYSVREVLPVEGLDSPASMVKYAGKLGIQIMALTDHDVIKGWKEALKAGRKYDVTIIPGEEISVQGDVHMLGLGLTERVKPNLGVLETIDEIKSQGAISIASHPFDVLDKGIKEQAKYCTAIEAFNSINLDRLANRKAKQFAIKNKKPMTAGGDVHCLAMFGRGITMIDCEPEMESVLKAIRKGKTDISKAKYQKIEVMQDWTMKRLQLSQPNVIQYMEKNYSMPKRVISKKLLTLTKYSPGKIDYIFRGLSYLAVGGSVLYSTAKQIGRGLKRKKN